MSIIVNILLVLCTAILTGYVSSLNFRKERFWEYKAKYYTEIIEALHNINVYFDFQYNDYEAVIYH